MRGGEKTDAEHSGSGMPGRTPPHGLATFGSAPATGRRVGGRSFKNPTDAGLSVTTIRTRGDGDWSRLQDEAYFKDEIHTEHTYQVELTNSPEHKSIGGSSRDSIIKRAG
jgi:hypothetical protein